MNISMTEKIKIVLVKKRMLNKELAEKLGWTFPLLSKKMKKDNFTQQELQQIAEALDCDLDISFTMREIGEKI